MTEWYSSLLKHRLNNESNVDSSRRLQRLASVLDPRTILQVLDAVDGLHTPEPPAELGTQSLEAIKPTQTVVK